MSELRAYKADVTIPVYGTIADAQVYLKSEAGLSHSRLNSDSLGLSGNYERELVDELKKAFSKAEKFKEATR